MSSFRLSVVKLIAVEVDYGCFVFANILFYVYFFDLTIIIIFIDQIALFIIFFHFNSVELSKVSVDRRDRSCAVDQANCMNYVSVEFGGCVDENLIRVFLVRTIHEIKFNYL